MNDMGQYGSIITEQGDLGLGVTPIHESQNEEKNKDKQKNNK